MEQSMVGKVLSNWAIMPPMVGLFSTSTTIAVVGQIQGGLNAGHAPADDQGALGHGNGVFLQGFQQPNAGNRHPHQIQGLLRGCLRFLHVYPTALLPQVGHFHEIGIDAGRLQHLLEGGFVKPGGAGGHHHPVQAHFQNIILDFLLARLGAGVGDILADRHVFKPPAKAATFSQSTVWAMFKPQWQT
jgi:hypothetical protein